MSLPPPPPPPPPAGSGPAPPAAPSPGAPPSPASPPSPSRRAVTAWKVVGSVLAGLTLLWGGGLVAAQIAHEERTTTSEYPAAGLTALDVSVDAGAITVVATTGDVVRVTARVSEGLRATSESQAVRDGTLVLRGGCATFFDNFCDVTYTVEVPAGVDVVARSQNDHIRLSGLDGTIDAHTGNGDVSVRGGRARVVAASSDNGDVTGADLRAEAVDADSDNGAVALQFATAPRTVEATSDNGDVEVLLPDDGTAYAIDVSSGNGSTAAPIRTDPDADRAVRARSDNGDVLVAYLAR